MKLTQKDGYGAAWYGADGTIGWMKRRYAHVKESGPKFALPEFIAKKVAQADGFSASNDIPSDGGFLIIHGRIATNPVTLNNTHPMMNADGSAAMIHNGMVWSDLYDNTPGCTCDSELLLQAYLAGGIDEVNAEVDGYFAFMMLQLDEEGRKLMHVAKDARAALYGGKMKKGYAFATNEILLEGVKAEVLGEVKDSHVLVFDGAESVDIQPFDKREVVFLSEWERNQRKQHKSQKVTCSQPNNVKQLTDGDRTSIEAELEEITRQEQEELRYGGMGWN